MNDRDIMLEEMRRELAGSFGGEEDISDEAILNAIDELVLERGRAHMLSLREKEELRKDLFYSVRRLDVIQELADDPSVDEIMVNGFDRIFYESQGKIYRYEKSFADERRLYEIVQQIAGRCNRAVNERSPIVDARLKNGDRVNIVLPPVALDGPVLTIRKFPASPITMERLIAVGSITQEAASELKTLVEAGYTIIVSGGTSTGKTTFLNALSRFIPAHERIVTIEDNAELQLKSIENIVRLETKPANSEENREITIRDLIKTALRMRPSRIIVGEVRGAETADFLSCLNTGHEGSLGSAHANSTKDLIYRLEMMVRMGMELPIGVIRQQIASGVEIIVQLYRDASGRRKVEEICEVESFDGERIGLNVLYRRDEENRLKRSGELAHPEKRKKYEDVIKNEERKTWRGQIHRDIRHI